MPVLNTLTSAHVGAIALAAVGAVLFGLAAVRQHGAVRTTGSSARLTLSGHIAAALRLVREPDWLIGSGQAAVAGALHIVALALAPITLVQPIGVLAVPVTVVATAIREHRAPRRAQVLGAAASVIGIVVLTVALAMPAAVAPTMPGWVTLAATVLVLLTSGIVVTLVGGRVRPGLRCVSLAATAAVLFGVNSVLIRTIESVLTAGSVTGDRFLLVTALVGIAAALPLGIWAMQRAYALGSSQVVICCLTLLDPVTAVLGGQLLLHDGGSLTGWAWVGVVLGGLVATGGVILLSGDYPADDQATPDPSGAAVVEARVGITR